MNQSFCDWRHNLLPCLLALALASCGGGGDPEEPIGQVTFAPDWGSMPASSALRFHFYPATGAVVTKDCDATGFSGALDAGTYRVLAYNTDGKGFVIENADSYDKAAVRVAPVANTRTLSAVAQPDKVYVMNLGDLTVETGGTVNQKLAVRNLARPLALRFAIGNSPAVRSIQGAVNGFLPSVQLVTGKPEAASVASAKETSILFDVALSGATASADLHCLGMSDPKGASPYACTLWLNITLNDGRIVETEVDITDAISGILSQNGGVLPDGIAAEIKIDLGMVSDMDFHATIASWSPGGTLGGDL